MQAVGHGDGKSTETAMQRPRVIVVGGMDFNIPDEMRKRFEIVKHLEQKVNRVDRVPEADYVFVISDFVSHTMVDIVKHMAKVPVVYLRTGWSHMKLELERRSILPPEIPEAAEEPARPVAVEKKGPEATGLSEDELWDVYKKDIIAAAKGALKPRELVGEEDLLEILGDLVGIPKEELRPLLVRLHMGGVLDQPKDKVWCLMIGDDGFVSGKNMPEEGVGTKKTVRRHRPAGEGEDRAKKIAGLRMGPYPTLAALAREMLKYEEFQFEGRPMSMEGCRQVIKRAIELKIVDDTHEKIYVDYNAEVHLKRISPAEPEELTPVEQPPLSDEGKLEKSAEEAYAYYQSLRPAEITKEMAEKAWRVIIDEVRSTKRHIATILENSRIEWLADKNIICCLVPQEYSVYMRQLESTENWGLISSITRNRFGNSVVVRFLLDNSMSKGRV
jgi:hypothetical protein